MIVLTAGHTGPDTGAQCAATHFDEGAENIWLRNRIAEILTNDYGVVVLVDEDEATLQLVKKRIEENAPYIDFVIDLHFNAHTNPNARGSEAIVADDATTLELRFASRLAHTTSDALDIPLRCIKSESQTPHHRLAMLHLTPQSIILEVCFCTSPEDVEAYRNNREKLAADLALAIYELL